MALLFAFIGAAKAQIIQIGDLNQITLGPVSGVDSYSFSEQVYTAGEIGMAGTITSIYFKNYSGEHTYDIDVFMKHVSRETFANENDYEPVTAADIVFSGTWNTIEGWSVLVLDTPFDYDGTSNLLIAFDKNGPIDHDAAIFYGSAVANGTLMYHGDLNNPDPFDLGSFGGTKDVNNYRSDIRIEFFASSGPAPAFVDFETNDFSQFPFVNDATYPWTVTDEDAFEGTYCMKSGNGGVHSSSSTIEATVDYANDGYITFYAHCMGEGTSWDVCSFNIDGTEQFAYGANVEGWHIYFYEVTAGTHTFSWIYTKDSSTHPDGDGFYVDNITFEYGSPCIAPSYVHAMPTPSETHVVWDGISETFTLQYRKTSATIWTSVNNLTANEYTITNLEAGNYIVRVQSNCDPDNWMPANFMVYIPETTANWYAFVKYSYGGATWESKYVYFTMQNPATVTAATTDFLSYNINAGTFANGYVWIVDQMSGNLMKASISDNYHFVGSFENVMEGFSTNYIVAMQFNPANGRMYFVEQGMNTLKSFEINNPSTVSTHGSIGFELTALAIDKEGHAFGLEYPTGKLYSINLSNATTTEVGETGLEVYLNNNTMAFDMETGELFWSSNTSSGPGLYYVDHTNAGTMLIGQLGDDGAELVSMFMVYDYNTVAENHAGSINVYPNPAHGPFTVEGNGMLNVSNVLGQTILTREINGQTTIELPEGLYFVRIGDTTRKVVIE